MLSYDALNFVQGFMKIFFSFKSKRVGLIFILKITKGHNSINNIGGVIVLVLCILSNEALYFVQSIMK